MIQLLENLVVLPLNRLLFLHSEISKALLHGVAELPDLRMILRGEYQFRLGTLAATTCDRLPGLP